MSINPKKVDMTVLDDVYRLTKMAVDFADGDGKDRLIGIAEDEVKWIASEADRVFTKIEGNSWREKVAVISSSLCGVALETMHGLRDMKELDEMTEEQKKLFFGMNKAVGQVGFVVGLVLALKAAGVWDEYKNGVGNGNEA